MNDLSPNTLNAYSTACRSFERIVGKPVSEATARDVESWLFALRADGISAATCRTYLSAINREAGLHVTPSGLPRVQRDAPLALSLAQVQAMMRVMGDENRGIFMNMEHLSISEQAANRRLKVIAKLAGIAGNMTLKVWRRAIDEFQVELGGMKSTGQISWAPFVVPGKRDGRLHGIGRRTRVVAS